MTQEASQQPGTATAASKTITVVVDAFTTGECGSNPVFAAFEVTQAFVDKLESVGFLCKQHVLSEARFVDGPVWGDGSYEAEERLQCGEIVVGSVFTGGSFYFEDYPKYGAYLVQTRSREISELKKCFESAKDGDVVYLTQDSSIREMYEAAHGLATAEVE